MILTESEQRELEVKMRYFGHKEYTHAFFDSKEYESFRNAIISGVPSSEDSRLNIAFCDVHDVLEAGKYVVCKHTNGIDIRVPYTNFDCLASSVIKNFDPIPKREDYNEIYNYIKNNCELPKVTDIPLEFECAGYNNGRTSSTLFYSKDKVEVDFYDDLPIITIKMYCKGMCNDLTKSIYVHEMYHALINRNKNNIKNALNREMVSIFMEKVAALDLDPTLELFKLKTLDRIISIKGDVLKRESYLFEDEQHLDILIQEGYILSTLEATALFSTYQNGSNRIKREIDNDINKVISGDAVLEDVIDKYEAAPEKGSRLVKRQIKKLF